MIKSKAQDDIRNLLDLHVRLSDHEIEVCKKVDGPPPERKPVTRQPYDSLYVKLKRQESL